MKPEQQRIAIAEACGKKVCTHSPKEWERKGTDGDSDLYCGICKSYLHDMRCPNYLNDLNAMHEAEMCLEIETDQLHFFARYLWEAMQGSKEVYYGTVHATSAQRAEAFLRTIGKWVEE